MHFYKVDDCGLLIGMMTSPSGTSVEDFYQKEIVNNLSKNYLKGLHDNMKGDKPKVFNLFRPVGFRIFGEHNLATLMLIDDFAYPYRYFHPAHGLRDDEAEPTLYNYEYQVNTCIDVYEKNASRDHLEHFFTEVCEAEVYPFICITHLKVNNGFLLGNGIDFVELVKDAIRDEATRPVYAGQMQIRVLDNLGNSELTVLAFSYNFTSVALFTHAVRSMKMENLRKKWEQRCSGVIINSLSYRLWEKQKKEEEKPVSVKESELWDSHLFASSYSYPGYRMDTKDKKISDYRFEKGELDIFLKFIWDVKPGHPFALKEKLSRILQKDVQDNLYLSNSSWVYQLEYKASEKETFFPLIQTIGEVDQVLEHSRKLHTRVELKVPEGRTGNPFEQSSHEIQGPHPNLKEYLNSKAFKMKELRQLRDTMEKCRISKVMRERVMKMFNNFNDCIQDPVFFINFLDLRGFLESLIFRIEDYRILQKGEECGSSLEFHEWINFCIHSFEQAYLNRFHQSMRMLDMSDFNIEWNGGIQQLISPFDFVWKKINEYLTDHNSYFMYVSGYERVHVSSMALRLNMQHITYPEIFTLSIWKEVFNHYLSELFKATQSREKTGKKSRESGLEERVKLERAFEKLSRYNTDEYREHIRKDIAEDPDFDFQSKVQKNLYASFDEEFYVSLAADSIAFYVGYNGDLSLFNYYYWRLLSQTTYHYNAKGELSPSVFVSFLCRILFVVLLENEENVAEAWRFRPPDPVLADYWLRYFDETFRFVRILHRVLDRHDYITAIKGGAFHMILCEMDGLQKRFALAKDKEVQECAKGLKELIQMTENFPGKYQYWLKQKKKVVLKDGTVRDLDTALKLRHDDFNTQKEIYRELMKRNIVIQENSYHHYTQELYINTLLHAFLEYIRSLDIGTGDNESEQVKIRLHSMSMEELQYTSNILAHSQGGMFVVDYEVRRKYFAARALLYHSLFDYCMKNKC